MDLLMSQNRQRYPRRKVILAHAGGTLPWTFPRVSNWRRGLSRVQVGNGITYDDMIRDFLSFSFDIAFSSSHQGLDLLLKVVASDHILYGSDFPYAPQTSASNLRDDLESRPTDQDTRAKIYYRNALDPIPRLRHYLYEDHSRL
ncbi:hypothetical protein ABEF95_004962 [Exophiala dermatitidis]